MGEGEFESKELEYFSDTPNSSEPETNRYKILKSSTGNEGNLTNYVNKHEFDIPHKNVCMIPEFWSTITNLEYLSNWIILAIYMRFFNTSFIQITGWL